MISAHLARGFDCAADDCSEPGPEPEGVARPLIPLSLYHLCHHHYHHYHHHLITVIRRPHSDPDACSSLLAKTN